METPEFLTTLTAMREFLDASRSKSQEQILKAFLQNVIHRRHLCDSGSVLIDYPEERMLHLFNPDNFLTKQGYLKPGEPWQVEFAYDQGLAGEAFNKREAIYVENTRDDPRFSTVEGQVPIASMLCVPIITSDRAAPFGVVSFHNSSAAQPFAEDARSFCQTFVSVLALGLSGASERLDRRGVGHRRLFIGCASEDLAAARKIQSYLRDVALVRIWNQGAFKAGGYILETLLRAVKEYDCAIFLLTPNDVVEFRGAQYLVARDNVLFEAGLFFSQLGRGRTLLIVPEVRQLKLPSDLDGLIRLTYKPPENPNDLELALAPVCNDIMDILCQPLSPIV